MKNALVLSLALISSAASADVAILAPAAIVPAAQLYETRINTVTATAEGDHFPSAHVKVNATFGNACSVPRAEELVIGVGYRNGYSDLALNLYSKSARMCPMNYNPVTVTFDLGTYTRPNDGGFRTISVNGIIAK